MVESSWVSLLRPLSLFLGLLFLSWEHALLQAQNIEINLKANLAVGQQCAFSSCISLGLYPAWEVGGLSPPLTPAFSSYSTL